MENITKATKAIRHSSIARQLASNKNYTFKEVEGHLIEAIKYNKKFAELDLANLYKKHKMFKEALYWYEKTLFIGLDHNLLIELASWYEEGIGTEVNYDKAAELYLRIAHSNNEALIRLLSLHKDNKTSYLGTIPQRNNLQYWQNLLARRVKEGYWDINRTKERITNNLLKVS